MENKKRIENIKIKTPYITLGQFLKFTSLISNGGEAKYFISNNTIKLNNNVVTERGKKLYPQDIISINDSTIFEIQDDN